LLKRSVFIPVRIEVGESMFEGEDQWSCIGNEGTEK
jgi:hypothetical protein